jgi:hypothetical protein
VALAQGRGRPLRLGVGRSFAGALYYCPEGFGVQCFPLDQGLRYPLEVFPVLEQHRLDPLILLID